MTITVNVEGLGPVKFPDSYTPERIKFAIENDILPKLKSAQSKDTGMATPEAPTAVERVGRGMSDVGEGLKQGALMVKDLFTGKDEAGAYTREKSNDLELYEKGRRRGATKLSDLVAGKEGDPGIDWMRLGGNVAATVPAMAIPGANAATLPLRMLSGGAQGAAASGAMFTPEGDSKAAQVATGAAVGGAVPVLAEAGRSVVRKIGDLVRPAQSMPAQRIESELTVKLQQQGVDFGALTKEVRQSLVDDAQKALQAGGTLDDVMLANKAVIESVGATPTKASITRNPKDWQTEKNLRGVTNVGEPIARREAENAAAMTDYLGKLRQGSGAKASNAYQTGESAIGAIKASDSAKEKAVGELYDAFRASGAVDSNVPATKLADTLGRVADEIGTENIPGPVMARLKEFGLLGEKQTKALTVNEADKLNRLINNNNPGNGPQSLALGRIKAALNESLLDIPESGASEMLMKARKAAAQRFSEQDAAKGITAALDDVAPDRFVERFITGRNVDARDLKATLGELSRTEGGKQAVKDIKGHVFDTLIMKATGNKSMEDVAWKASQQGGLSFSGKAFSNALNEIPAEKLHQLFSPTELEALRNLQKASRLLTEEVPFSDVNYSKTAAGLANIFQKIGETPLLGQLVSPIIGAGKIGTDWVKDGAARKAVAEALIASAGKSGGKPALPAPNMLEKVAPAMGGAFTNPRDDAVRIGPRDRSND